MELDTTDAVRSDSIRDTVDYSAVYTTVQEIVEGKPYKLIEKVAAVIAIRSFVPMKGYRRWK